MYVECPTCGDEIEITNIHHSPGGYDEPEDFDYDFAEEHGCQANWDSATQQNFDDTVYQRAMERDVPDYDFYGVEDDVKWE